MRQVNAWYKQITTGLKDDKEDVQLTNSDHSTDWCDNNSAAEAALTIVDRQFKLTIESI